MNIQEMPDIAKVVKEDVEKHIKIYPVRANYASECGHECERYLYYQRMHWDQKHPHNSTLEFIFTGGRAIEEMAVRELTGAGYRVVETQRPFEWADFELTGRIDCRIRLNGRLVPIEIKGYAHPDYVKLETMKDLIDSKKPWIRRAPAQLLVYMWMMEEPIGGIYLKSKSTYVPKVIWCDINDHVAYVDKILKKLQRVNDAIHAGEIPARTEYDEKICLDCGYFHLCKPDVALGEGANILNDPDLAEILARRERLKELKKEYEEVDEYVKQRFKGVGKAICGNYIITGKQISFDTKPKPAGHTEYWRTDIRRMASEG